MTLGETSDTVGPEMAEEAVRPRRVAVVPHTHWDREWYDRSRPSGFKLVHLVDDLLDQLERDSAFSHFLLDGQIAVIDDYLEMRPENESRLRALAAAGRITVGPWYILMDEFLVSGETLVRNLQAGAERGAAFGGVMSVGYLPDMFGHVAQMPQLLAPGRDAARRRVAGRALGRRPVGILVDLPRRLEGPGRVPDGRLRQRSRPAR